MEVGVEVGVEAEAEASSSSRSQPRLAAMGGGSPWFHRPACVGGGLWA